MAEVEIIMPKMGESIIEATVLGWLKQEGDKVEQDESLLEVATDKVDTEVPSTHGGVIKKILAKEGDVIPVGNPIAIITTESNESISSDPVVKDEAEASLGNAASSNGHDAVNDILSDIEHATETVKNSGNRFYSPLVKSIASKEGISQQELDAIGGSGKEGRVTKKDLLDYVEAGRKAKPAASVPTPSSAPKPMPVIIDGGDEIIEMDRMRRMIAERMVDSKRISPHVTSFVEADVTGIVKWRNKNKNLFMEREKEPLTFTPIFIEAVCKAILDYPNINVQVDGTRIIKKKDINIGLAVALPTGNLIVPVIRNADKLSLSGLATAVNTLARKARNNELKPDDLSGGTFTVSNVGSFGNVMGTPIIMQPQVGILATGAIVKKPAVIETPEGDTIGIRHKMFLSHSYDHRVVDGALGGMVVRRIADYLESFDLKRTI